MSDMSNEEEKLRKKISEKQEKFAALQEELTTLQKKVEDEGSELADLFCDLGRLIFVT